MVEIYLYASNVSAYFSDFFAVVGVLGASASSPLLVSSFKSADVVASMALPNVLPLGTSVLLVEDLVNDEGGFLTGGSKTLDVCKARLLLLHGVGIFCLT